LAKLRRTKSVSILWATPVYGLSKKLKLSNSLMCSFDIPTSCRMHLMYECASYYFCPMLRLVVSRNIYRMITDFGSTKSTEVKESNFDLHSTDF